MQPQCFQSGSPQISSPPFYSNPTQPSRLSPHHTFLAEPNPIGSLTNDQLFAQTHKNRFNDLSQIVLPNHIEVYSRTMCASLPASTTWTCVCGGWHMGDHETAVSEWLIDCSFSRPFFSPPSDALLAGMCMPRYGKGTLHRNGSAEPLAQRCWPRFGALKETSKRRQDRPGTQKPASHLLLMPETAECQNESLFWAVRLMWPFIDSRRRLGMLKGEGFYALRLIPSGTPQSCHVPHTW